MKEQISSSGNPDDYLEAYTEKTHGRTHNGIAIRNDLMPPEASDALLHWIKLEREVLDDTQKNQPEIERLTTKFSKIMGFSPEQLYQRHDEMKQVHEQS